MATNGLTSDSPPGDWTADRLRPGSVIAGYQLEDQIGRGGMAVVFRARDARLGRQVALKLLAPALAADAAFRRRFVRESRAAAVVDDPHIVPIFEAGQSGEVLFIAMKLVSGGDVRRLLRRHGSLSAARTASIVSPVASALDAAQATGLVHRDVKPANMLLDVRPGRPDHVYLADFGLSKRALSPGQTSAGLLIGTPHYMAPEHIGGGHVDGRTDQYSLACVAFELLSGGLPFQGGNAVAVIHAHAFDQPPPLTSVRPGLPTAVDPVLARALAKAPADRYPTCQEFAEALRAALALPPYADEPTATRDRPHAEERAGVLAADQALAEGDRAGREQGATAVAGARPDRPPAPGRHRRRRLLALGIAAAIVVGAGVAARELTGSSAPGRLIPVMGSLEGVAAASPRSIWALGGSCAFNCVARAQTFPALIAHWNGTSWSDIPSPVRDARLGGIAVGRAGAVWAVGYSCVSGCGTDTERDRALILQWDGHSFAQVRTPSPGLSARLAGVTAGPSGTAYAAGYYCTSGCDEGKSEIDRTLLLSWNHGKWSRVASDSPGRIARLTEVSADAAGAAWAVGYYCYADCGGFFDFDHTLTLRPAKARWQIFPSPSPGLTAQLDGVSVGSGGTAWAAGFDTAGMLIMRWATRGWHTVNITSPGSIRKLFGVSVAAGGVVWAVGSYCVPGCNAYVETDRTLIVRLADGGSHAEASPKPDTIGRLIGISSGPGGTAWAVGYSCVSRCGTTSERDRTLVLRSNGTTWIAG